MKIKVRVIRQGTHVKAGVWSGAVNRTLSSNGMLVFSEAEWELFRSLLLQDFPFESATNAISRLEKFLAKNSSIEDETCPYCGREEGEEHEPTCLYKTRHELILLLIRLRTLARAIELVEG